MVSDRHFLIEIAAIAAYESACRRSDQFTIAAGTETALAWDQLTLEKRQSWRDRIDRQIHLEYRHKPG